jgi:adenylate cyclase class 2
MDHPNIELEVKFYISNLEKLETQLKNLGAKLVQNRTQEYNLRFDTPLGDFALGYRVLRLRQDTAIRLTYKGPGEIQDGVRSRQEIEIIVDDFDQAQALLEALGYQISMVYEKYRMGYELDGVLVTLDELPYGDFVEIEGPDTDGIKKVSTKLGLKWDSRILESYAILFDTLKRNLDISIGNLTFADFNGILVTPDHLGVGQGDG